MELRANFDEYVVVHAAQEPWQPSPMKGVDRRMLDRIGGEVARATSIVRYAPGSTFSAHTHTGGEEFVVLEGVFQDEHGDYPAGTYVRNPPTTSHTPRSDVGCTILVKLWQFDMDDRAQFRLTMADHLQDFETGIKRATLHQDPREEVCFWDAAPGATLRLEHAGGIEVFVLSGKMIAGGDSLERSSWVRAPEGSAIEIVAGPSGATLWTKAGHLPFARAPQV